MQSSKFNRLDEAGKISSFPAHFKRQQTNNLGVNNQPEIRDDFDFKSRPTVNSQKSRKKKEPRTHFLKKLVLVNARKIS